MSGFQTAAAQNIQGVINGRSGATMTLQTQDSGNVVVVLTPATEAGIEQAERDAVLNPTIGTVFQGGK